MTDLMEEKKNLQTAAVNERKALKVFLVFELGSSARKNSLAFYTGGGSPIMVSYTLVMAPTSNPFLLPVCDTLSIYSSH